MKALWDVLREVAFAGGVLHFSRNITMWVGSSSVLASPSTSSLPTGKYLGGNGEQIGIGDFG